MRVMIIMMIIIIQSIYNEIKARSNKIPKFDKKRQNLAYHSLLRETSKKKPFRFLMVIMRILTLIQVIMRIFMLIPLLLTIMMIVMMIRTIIIVIIISKIIIIAIIII